MTQTPSLEYRRTLLDRQQMYRAIRRMAAEIVERNRGTDCLALVGIRTRGVPLAEALRKEIEEMEGVSVPVGTLDIKLYRDDLSTVADEPVVKSAELPTDDLEGWTVVLCDDVLYTGRTVRAALDKLMNQGRPRRALLAVLIDRGHRELPIQADLVGEYVPTAADEVVEVRFEQTDPMERVDLYWNRGDGSEEEMGGCRRGDEAGDGEATAGEDGREGERGTDGAAGPGPGEEG